jgi:glutamyl-tRNA reductase
MLMCMSGTDALEQQQTRVFLPAVLHLQVKQVYKVGQNCPGFGRSLNGLFKQAITAGKRVRAETSISTGSVSVSSAAVELAQLKLPSRSWDGVRVCIIGAGKMSTLLVKHLLSKGCREVTVLNRSMPRAEALAQEFPEMKFNIHLMPDLMKCVEGSDVIFAASGSEELLIKKEDVERMGQAGDKVGGWAGDGLRDWDSWCSSAQQGGMWVG